MNSFVGSLARNSKAMGAVSPDTTLLSETSYGLTNGGSGGSITGFSSSRMSTRQVLGAPSDAPAPSAAINETTKVSVASDNSSSMIVRETVARS